MAKKTLVFDGGLMTQGKKLKSETWTPRNFEYIQSEILCHGEFQILEFAITFKSPNASRFANLFWLISAGMLSLRKGLNIST